jgi:hypothetical protein
MSFKMEDKTSADPQLEDNLLFGKKNGATFTILRGTLQKFKDLFLGTATLQTKA